ncbi:FAD binding domain-containing protein [Leptodontidium sp. 2 PMI_412]|nr:FAD binding domain-containing protein [Leptodontidium sp. 2 PMI_412]
MTEPEPTQVDVLVIGAGPSGLMLATWLSRCGISTRIVDKRASRINSGQADGLQSRTFEILDSLGIGADVWREANHMLEIRFWVQTGAEDFKNPDEHGQLYRSDAMADTVPGASRFQQATLHQGISPLRICIDYLLGYVHKHSSIGVERGVIPESLSIDANFTDSANEYPVSVTLRHMLEEGTVPEEIHGSHASGVPNGLFRSNLTADDTASLLENAQSSTSTRSEKVLAKYVVGCDGAHSWTRRQIGVVMEGEQTDLVWGVMDIIPITDFPDIRYRCTVRSQEFGSMMIIPRENKLVRLYIQITEKDGTGNCVKRSDISPEILLKSAQKILAPYKLSYKHCHWWTAYGIGQRVGSSFSVQNRVFLAGDAVHTHSPKAGQGMNISMHDTYNLGWKLASVIKHRSDPSLLSTYETERRKIAQELITFDHKFSRIFSGRPVKDILGDGAIDAETLQEAFKKGNTFTNGTSVNYDCSILVSKELESQASEAENFAQKNDLATGIRIGMRMPSFKVLNQSDARPWHFQELLQSNGCWRIAVFPGDLRDPDQFARFTTLGHALAAKDSFLRRYTPRSEAIDSVFEIITVHSAPRSSIELLSLHEVFHPFSEETGWDYNKVFVDDVSYHEGHGEAYKNYGISPLTGCVVVIRPDQHVSCISSLEGVRRIDSFFSGFMIEQK